MMEWLKKFSCGSGGYGVTLLRLCLSAFLFNHSIQHFHELTSILHPRFTSFSGLHMIYTMIFEGVGGLLLLFGLFVRLAGLLSLVLALESLYSHWGRWNGGADTAIVFLIVTLVVMIEGAGQCSVDQLIKK